MRVVQFVLVVWPLVDPEQLVEEVQVGQALVPVVVPNLVSYRKVSHRISGGRHAFNGGGIDGK